MKKKLLIVSGIILVFVLTVSLIGLNGKKSAYVDAGQLNIPRSHHTATKLKDGRVLVVGGITTGKIKESLGLDNIYVKNAEIYEPKTGKFSLVDKLKEGRKNHSATLLQDGRVLIAGGSVADKNKFGTSSCEIFDPNTNKFSHAGNFNIPKTGQKATLLKDGRVLITGGACLSKKYEQCETITEIFDLNTNKFSLSKRMNEIRGKHSNTLLKSGKVLIAGGGKASTSIFDSHSQTVEIFDPVSNTFDITGKMTIRRLGHTAQLLKDGRVLIAGGEKGKGNIDILRSIEIYDPQKYTFREIKRETHIPRNGKVFKFDALRYRRVLPDVFQINNDTFIISGGNIGSVQVDKIEVLKLIEDNYFIRLGEYEDISRHSYTTTLLNDNEILFIGGNDTKHKIQKTAKILKIDELLKSR